MARSTAAADIPIASSIFLQKLPEFTVSPKPNPRINWTGRPYVQRAKLIAWLKADSRTNPERVVSHAEVLLDKAYHRREIKIWVKDLLDGSGACAIVFCILLQMKKGHLVHRLYRRDIVDRGLPKSLRELEDLVAPLFPVPQYNEHYASQFAAEFDQLQWKYFPLDLTKGRSYDLLPAKRIIPILDRDEINGKGATAEIHQIVVQEEFVDEDLRSAVPASRFTDASDGLGPRYYFALKTFTEEKRAMYEAEREAYHKLRDQEHIVRCLGDFSHCDVDGRPTHNILLEYGDYDLAEYFLCTPPTLRHEIRDFWLDLVRVANAVDRIHHFEKPRAGKSELYEGWHADIKPDNILRVQQAFKLADPGFARFVRQTDKQEGGDSSTILPGRTLTYGAPETHKLGSPIREPYAVDIWSLGCVFSEAATWVVLGNLGRFQFQKLRSEAIKKAKFARLLSASKMNENESGDYFHDERDVLQEVRQWHAHLRDLIRPSDNFTRAILDLVDTDMLVGHPESRIKADALCIRLRYILHPSTDDRSATRLPNPVTDLIRSVIESTREEEIQVLIGGAPLGTSIRERKEYRSNPSLLQSRPELDPTRSRSQNANSLAYTPSVPKARMSSIARKPIPKPQSSPQLQAHPDDQVTPVGVPGSPDLNTTEQVDQRESQKAQNVFDAHWDREIREARFSGVLNKWLGSRTKQKDNFLSEHFQNRDLLFVVDNAASMLQYWSEVMFVLIELASKARGHDDDGMDLRFTNGGYTVSGAKDTKVVSEFKQAMNSPAAVPSGKKTDMADVLERILFNWLVEFRANKGRKGMTVIVLTNGEWSGMAHEKAVDEKITQFNRDLKSIVGGRVPRKIVSIQFVSFGEDPRALFRLRRLDDDLAHLGVPDIVDFEPSTGDIYKMLLGSIVEDMDARNKPVPVTSDSNSSLRTIATLGSTESNLSYTAGPDPQLTLTSSPPTRTRSIGERFPGQFAARNSVGSQLLTADSENLSRSIPVIRESQHG